MENFKILTETSPWFILLCLLAGAGYAFVLYNHNKGPWSEKINRLLFGLRFLVVSLLCFLLTGPFVKYIKNYFEKPSIVFAIDNSQSISFAQDSSEIQKIRNSLSSIISDLLKEDVEIEIQTLNQSYSADRFTGITYSEKSTNLSKQLNLIRENYENRNLAGVVMISDGIYNEGIDPLFQDYTFPIHTIGIGDTVPKKDINLKAVTYNKIAYAGNRFPVRAEIHNKGFDNHTLNVVIRQGTKVLESKKVSLDKKAVAEVEFVLSSETTGLQHYVIEVQPVAGEFTKNNNTGHAYVEVIKAREKILAVAMAPHPDIKALRSALESKENFDFEVYIPGLNQLKEDKYDLVIFHQFPDLYNSNHAVIEKILSATNSHFFIAGNQTNINQLNKTNSLLDIHPRGNQKDLVTPSYNKGFEKFRLENNEISVITGYPPIIVAFGDYSLKGQSDVLLYQKIGSLTTDQPLLVAGINGGKKSAVLAGEGIWQWRMNEFQETGSAKVFDKFFSSLIQYLSAKEDKRKFRLYPVSNEFSESEKVVFEAEVYNDIYEKVYDKKIELDIKDETGKTKKYSFTNSVANSRFEVKGLSPGLYKYTGRVSLDGKTHASAGEFIIKEQVLEALNITADHNLLRELSGKTEGRFFKSTQISELSEILKSSKKASVIHSSEEFQEIINLPWIFFLILILLTAEWGIRKYSGSY